MAAESGQRGGGVVRGLDPNMFSVVVTVFPLHPPPAGLSFPL